MREQALGEFLVSSGYLSTDGLRRGLEAQSALECRLGSVLLDLGLMSESSLLKALGRYCSARTVNSNQLMAIPPEVIKMVPARFALRHQVVPFRLVGKTLSVAAIDPADLLVEDELSQLTGCMIASFAALEVRLEEALAKYYGKQLSVQATSLLKRMTGGNGSPREDEAVVHEEAPATESFDITDTDVLTEVVEIEAASEEALEDDAEALSEEAVEVEAQVPSDDVVEVEAEAQRDERAEVATETEDEAPPIPGYRPGIPRPREKDPTMMVELSADDLADLPSFEESLEDTDVKKLRPSLAASDKSAEAVHAPATETAPDRDAETGPADVGERTIRIVERPIEVAEPPVERVVERPPETETGPVDTVDLRLDAAVDKMQLAEMREDIADAMLAFCAPYLRRRLLLAVRKNVVMGWRGEGEGIDPLWVRSMAIPLDEPSVFVSLTLGKELWRGSLPSMPGNQELLLGLGGEVPSQCLILPVFVRSRPIAFLYGDNIHYGLTDVPVDAIRRLVAKAGLAFQVYMLRNKMRTA
jgi:hypothetical protein